MRPVRLVAEGFSAFRERIDIDFEGVEFFALVGPTGAGKSSVIDAICFALYGSVPRYDREGAVDPVITIGGLQAKVSLTFEIGGERFIVTRVAVRNPKGGGATTREARLEKVTGETTEVLASSAPEVTAAVESLIGLVFKHFIRCVVLPQGEFARFLHDKPSARQDLLVSLLDIDVYNKMGQRSRAIAEQLRNDLALREARLAALDYATETAETEARSRIAALAELRADLATVAAEVERLAAAGAEAQKAVETALSLASALGDIEVPAAVATAASQLNDLDEAAARANLALEAAEAIRQRLDADVAALPELSGLLVAEIAHQEARRLAGELEAATDKVRNAAAIRDTSRIPAESAGIAVEAAEASLASLRRTHSAAELAEHLLAGASCPVCLQTVTALPPRSKPADLAVAEKAAQTARDKARFASQDLASAEASLAGATAAAEALGRQLDEAVSKASGHPDAARLVTLIGEVRTRHDELAASRKDEEKARREAADAKRDADRVRSSFDAAWQPFGLQRDRVVALGPPQPDRSDLLGSWTALAEWAAAARPGQLDLVAANSTAAKAATESARAQVAQFTEQCERHGVQPMDARRATTSPGATVAALRESVVAAATDAEHRLRAITEGIKERGRLTAECEALSEDAAVAQMLGKLLDATGFERWLVREALELLVDGASTTLMRLSSEQYSLARDERNEFVVVDHRNADERRSAKSLSGGETFQASLALALALADQISGLSAAGAKRLEAIFLDEGFGTLDPDTLAVVADAIESLGSSDRMVGVVTHVRELAERVPVRYEVSRGLRTSTVERVSG